VNGKRLVNSGQRREGKGRGELKPKKTGTRRGAWRRHKKECLMDDPIGSGVRGKRKAKHQVLWRWGGHAGKVLRPNRFTEDYEGRIQWEGDKGNDWGVNSGLEYKDTPAVKKQTGTVPGGIERR